MARLFCILVSLNEITARSCENKKWPFVFMTVQNNPNIPPSVDNHQATKIIYKEWRCVAVCSTSNLCFEGLLDVCAQCAPFVSLLQSLNSLLHPTLNLVDFHQNLENMIYTLSSFGSYPSLLKKKKHFCLCHMHTMTGMLTHLHGLSSILLKLLYVLLHEDHLLL